LVNKRPGYKLAVISVSVYPLPRAHQNLASVDEWSESCTVQFNLDMKCVVGLDCVSYIAVHFCLNIRQLTELWIWDLVANGWPLFRCAVLFMFVVRRDSWASNPSLWNASRAWSWLSKKRSEARPSCSVRHVERNCI